MKKQYKYWKLMIRNEIFLKAKVIEYLDGTFFIDTGKAVYNKYYKSYKACEKYLIKEGFIPDEEV